MSIDLDAKSVYSELSHKGIKSLHHANTVATSKSFISQLALLSREQIENLDLQQTPQKSDITDRKFGIYNDIFFDGADLSEAFKRPNIYGPVLFKFDAKILELDAVSVVRIARVNPYYWTASMSEERKYYTSIEEFSTKYSNGKTYNDAHACIMLPSINGHMPFTSGLQEIIIDDPKMTQNETPIIDLVTSHLFPDLTEFQRNCPLVKVLTNTQKATQYKNMDREEFLRMFRRTLSK